MEIGPVAPRIEFTPLTRDLLMDPFTSAIIVLDFKGAVRQHEVVLRDGLAAENLLPA